MSLHHIHLHLATHWDFLASQTVERFLCSSVTANHFCSSTPETELNFRKKTRQYISNFRPLIAGWNVAVQYLHPIFSRARALVLA